MNNNNVVRYLKSTSGHYNINELTHISVYKAKHTYIQYEFFHLDLVISVRFWGNVEQGREYINNIINTHLQTYGVYDPNPYGNVIYELPIRFKHYGVDAREGEELKAIKRKVDEQSNKPQTCIDTVKKVFS